MIFTGGGKKKEGEKKKIRPRSVYSPSGMYPDS